jgi:hypothetical protein
MNLDIEEVVNSGILKPATSLRVTKDIEDEFKEGLMFGDKDDVLAGGFNVNVVNTTSEVRVKKLAERANHSDYIILPTKFSFPTTVRIYG